MPNWLIRTLEMSDVDRVYEIECESFVQPWKKEVFILHAARNGVILTDHLSRVIAKVIEVDGMVHGYIVWEEDFSHSIGRVLNIAVSKEERRQGLGGKLMRHVFAELKSAEMTQCVLEARESNIGACAFYRHLGMHKIDRIPRYYGDEDAIVFYIRL